jgi:predicted 3-demethylubiquinone-9 3-methyltransferase (glyoxalase superfamily)
MGRITPYLWFDKDADDAAHVYASAFPGARIASRMRQPEGAPLPAGPVMSVTVSLFGQDVILLNGGPAFAHTPAASFFVTLPSDAEVDAAWNALSRGGTALMELGQYPFSPRYGWVQDRFGVSWQLSRGDGPARMSAFLMFCGPRHGSAAAAVRFYQGLFEGSSIETMDQDGAGLVRRASFTLAGRPFMAFDGGADHAFAFTPGFSLFIACPDQDEVDRLWRLLGEGGEELQCGWVTDRFGVSWQVVPDALGRLMGGGSPEQSRRVMAAMLKMKKLDAAELQRAFDG